MTEWGRQDSNLRPSAPKALNSSSSALGFQAITIFLLISAKFVRTNQVIFDRKLTANSFKTIFTSILYIELLYLNQLNIRM